MRMLSSKGGGHRACANENARPHKEWIVGSLIDWRGKQVLVNMLGSEGVDCEIPYRLESNEAIPYKGVETFP